MTPEQELKKAFAKALLFNPNNPFQAAKSVTEGDVQAAMGLSTHLVYDKEVLEFKKELIEERGADAFLPTKADMFSEVWRRANNTEDNDQFVKLAHLACDIRGFKEAPARVIVNNTNNEISVNKVLVIPMREGSDANWEKQLMAQQQALITDD